MKFLPEYSTILTNIVYCSVDDAARTSVHFCLCMHIGGSCGQCLLYMYMLGMSFVAFCVPSVFACCFLHLKRPRQTNLKGVQSGFDPFGDRMI